MCVSGREGCLNVFLFISHCRGCPGEASGHKVTQHTGLVRFTGGFKVLAVCCKCVGCLDFWIKNARLLHWYL